jgi:hypothetical protein
MKGPKILFFILGTSLLQGLSAGISVLKGSLFRGELLSMWEDWEVHIHEFETKPYILTYFAMSYSVLMGIQYCVSLVLIQHSVLLLIANEYDKAKYVVLYGFFSSSCVCTSISLIEKVELC